MNRGTDKAFIIVVGGAIILAILIMIGSILPASALSSTPKYDVTCYVEVNNPVALESKISEVKGCISREARLFSIYPKSIFADEGKLEMVAQEKRTSVDFSVREGLRRDYEITLKKLNPGSTSILFRLLDNDGGAIDTMSYSYSVG